MAAETVLAKQFLQWFGHGNREALRPAFSKSREPTDPKQLFPDPSIISLDTKKRGLRVTTKGIFGATGGGWWKIPPQELTPQMKRVRNSLVRDNVTYTPLGRVLRPLLTKLRKQSN